MADNNVENLSLEYQQYRLGKLEQVTLQRNENNENFIDNLIEIAALNFPPKSDIIIRQQANPFDNCSTHCLTGIPTCDTNAKIEDTGICSTSSSVFEPIYKSEINSNECNDMASIIHDQEALTSSLTEQNKMEIFSYLYGSSKEYGSASGMSNKDTRSNHNADVTESFEVSRNSFQINNPETTGNIGNKGFLHRKRGDDIQGIIKFSEAPNPQIFPKKGSVIECDTSKSEHCNNLKLLVPSKDTVAVSGPSRVSSRAQGHLEEGLIIGTACREGFVCEKEVVVHYETHKSKKPFACDTCGKRFPRKGLMTNHLRIHTGEKPYSCDQCKYRTNLKYNLKKHSFIHTSEMPYSCEICCKKFKRMDQLNSHHLTHDGEKPYSFDMCDYKSKQKGDPDVHRLSHTDEKQLTNHLRIHKGEKPFSCDQCKYRTYSKGHLTRHSVRHTSEMPYLCDKCGFKFKRKDLLNLHLLIHSRE